MNSCLHYVSKVSSSCKAKSGSLQLTISFFSLGWEHQNKRKIRELGLFSLAKQELSRVGLLSVNALVGSWGGVVKPDKKEKSCLS